jgi:hypothetical protein
VGHDLTRGTSQFTKAPRPGGEAASESGTEPGQEAPSAA